MGRRLTIELSEEVYGRLERFAAGAGQTVEQAAIRWLACEADRLTDDPFDGIIGCFDSGGVRWGEEHDRYLGDAALGGGPAAGHA